MTTDKHTPGPWVYDPKRPARVYSGDATGSVIAQCGSLLSWVRRSDEECAANARLIAAAPDMLKVLKNVERSLNHLGAKGQPLKSIRAVIAKAEA